LKAALNLPLDVLDGYKGGADARMAVESGEVDGYCGSWQTVETVWRGAYESGKIHAVLQASLESYPKYKNVPLAINYVKTDLARQLVTVADSAHGAQFPYTVPPGLSMGPWRMLTSQLATSGSSTRVPGRPVSSNTTLPSGPTTFETNTVELPGSRPMRQALQVEVEHLLRFGKPRRAVFLDTKPEAIFIFQDGER